jgi:hypothetical protein
VRSKISETKVNGAPAPDQGAGASFGLWGRDFPAVREGVRDGSDGKPVFLVLILYWFLRITLLVLLPQAARAVHKETNATKPYVYRPHKPPVERPNTMVGRVGGGTAGVSAGASDGSVVEIVSVDVGRNVYLEAFSSSTAKSSGGMTRPGQQQTTVAYTVFGWKENVDGTIATNPGTGATVLTPAKPGNSSAISFFLLFYFFRAVSLFFALNLHFFC